MEQQKAFVGKGSSQELFHFIEKKNISSVFLVRGKNAYRTSGAEKLIHQLLSNYPLQLTDYFDFSTNPKIEDIKRGINLLQQSNAQLIIAIGGGSVLDMAKSIRFFNNHEGDIEGNNYTQIEKNIPLVALPTTAGTGSETTHFAVVYKNQVKYSVAHPNILPEMAIIDPIFTYQTPPYLSACAGFDALAQAIEAYWNIFATEESDNYAVKAIHLLWKHLPLVILENNIESRNLVSEASFYAGKAINITKTTAPHAFSYPFTSYYNFHHGHAVALTFPFFMQFNFVKNIKNWNGKTSIEKHHTKMYTLYQILGITSADDALHVMKNYIQNLGLSFRLPQEFDQNLIIKNVNLERLANNPSKISEQEALAVVGGI